jgi:hypothetical protein
MEPIAHVVLGGLRFIALLGGLCVAAVHLKYTFAFHRLDQQR